MVFLNGFIAVFSTPIVGWISDKMVAKKGALKARTWANMWPALFVAFITCILLPHLAPMSLGMAFFITLAVGWGVPATTGPGVGLVLLIAGAGGIISPIFVPWLAGQTNWTIAWYVTGGFALLGMLINLYLSRYKAD